MNGLLDSNVIYIRQNIVSNETKTYFGWRNQYLWDTYNQYVRYVFTIKNVSIACEHVS